MAEASSRDMKRFPRCAPWYGEMGVAFERTFLPEFEQSARAYHDKFANEKEHLAGRRHRCDFLAQVMLVSRRIGRAGIGGCGVGATVDSVLVHVIGCSVRA